MKDAPLGHLVAGLWYDVPDVLRTPDGAISRVGRATHVAKEVTTQATTEAAAIVIGRRE